MANSLHQIELFNVFSKHNGYRTVYINIVFILIALSLITALSLSFAIWHERQVTRRLAHHEAMVISNKNISLREWVSKHGGIYVTPDKRTPPNPYLSNLPDRDVITTSGKSLTLMNPAYVLRQLMEEISAENGVRERITSLKALNPKNEPDDWERKVLLELEKGKSEISEVVKSSDGDYLRLIRPFITTSSCLKCHQQQGYKVGDVRGGISISIPLKRYIIVEKEQIMRVVITHSIFYLIGLYLISIAFFSMKRDIDISINAEKKLRIEIDSRRMAEKRLSLLLDATFEGVSIVENGRIIDFNKRLAEMY
ncbi:Tll0287-like domain-containing protein [Candidatus Magnetomonas plexicatena]|uniref:Tll0287-like domain-containing protein n=1 Tax=Candidatus Magnetomonas plexicatena TaxID=2552947 RepID=UPI00110489A8|nr:DUF3365 domain-containing protein [Nitrospirales bacterium LBB_01]